MAYWRDKWEFANSNEYEYKFAGNYGAKGEKRGKKKKATPEQIKKQNQRNKEKKIQRLIKANFCTDDYWFTLKYPAGTRKSLQELKEDLKTFLTEMRKAYKKCGDTLKFIYRIEIGKLGGVHIHILVNRIEGHYHTDLIAKECWKFGMINYETLFDSGGYKKLANYIVKPLPDEAYEQLNMFGIQEQKQFVKYSSSRNLIRPEPERKEYRRWTVKKLIEEGIKPTQGYYIDKDSINIGVNQYTGMSYLQYTEYRIKEINTRQYLSERKRC